MRYVPAMRSTRCWNCGRWTQHKAQDERVGCRYCSNILVTRAVKPVAVVRLEGRERGEEHA